MSNELCSLCSRLDTLSAFFLARSASFPTAASDAMVAAALVLACADRRVRKRKPAVARVGGG